MECSFYRWIFIVTAVERSLSKIKNLMFDITLALLCYSIQDAFTGLPTVHWDVLMQKRDVIRMVRMRMRQYYTSNDWFLRFHPILLHEILPVHSREIRD
jgi:transcriptional regulator of met regulon